MLGETGPFIVHNCTQAVCNDILRFATVNLRKHGYHVIMHVHDEIVCEVPEGFGSVAEMEAIMVQLPPWAADWPIRAAGGWREKRYGK